MNVSSNGHTNGVPSGPFADTGPNCILGPGYITWRRLQHGQEKITRFNWYLPHFGDRMRHQNGHEHRCSVCFLLTDAIIRISEYGSLDQLLMTRGINHHDEPEGILIEDKPEPTKTDEDDLSEYLVFKELYEPHGQIVWKEMQRCYLLQHCLKNPTCFPTDARQVMAELAKTKRHEALVFRGIQDWDYFHSAYEIWAERGPIRILHDVASGHLDRLDSIAAEVPGFKEVIWTSPRREYFTWFVKEMTPEPIP